jgi:hypothetical protein
MDELQNSILLQNLSTDQLADNRKRFLMLNSKTFKNSRNAAKMMTL